LVLYQEYYEFVTNKRHVKDMTFCVVMPCSSVELHGFFSEELIASVFRVEEKVSEKQAGRTCFITIILIILLADCFLLVYSLAYYSTMKMETIRSSETPWTATELPTRLITQKMVLFIDTALRASNPTKYVV
jgi:hypothetical protein